MAGTKTTTEILAAHDSTKSSLEKQISVANLQKVNKDTYLDPYNPVTNSGGYYDYVQSLDLLNEEYYLAITQPYDVRTAVTSDGITAKETLLPEYATKDTITVPDMKGNKDGVSKKCSDVHTSMKKMNTLQIYLNQISTLATDLSTCVEYLGKEANFDVLNWQI